jgi:phosphatidylserine/phosphatidylglycerophosphate/cardiolipin synthase-like enzyme
VIYDEAVATALHEAFNSDMEHSVRLTPVLYSQRSWTVKLREGLGRLISDIL